MEGSVQRLVIQLYKSAVAAGFRTPCFTSPSFSAPSSRAFMPVHCFLLRIPFSHIRSPSKLVVAPIRPTRPHLLSSSRFTPCKDYSRRLERNYYVGSRILPANGRQSSFWRRNSDVKDDVTAAGARKSHEFPSAPESKNGTAEVSYKKAGERRTITVSRPLKWANTLAALSSTQLREAIRLASLDEKVYDAVMLVKVLGLNDWSRKRKELNFIGGLLRDADPELMEQVLRACEDGDRLGSTSRRLSLPYFRPHYFNSSSTGGNLSRLWNTSASKNFDSSSKSNLYTAMVGTVSAMQRKPSLSVQHTREQVQLPNTVNTAPQFRFPQSIQHFKSSPSNFVPPVSRTVKVALQAVSKTKSHLTNGYALPQLARRFGKLRAQNQNSHLLTSRKTPDVGVTSQAVDSGRGEAWERAAHQLGILVLAKPLSLSALKTEVPLSEFEPEKSHSSTSIATDRNDYSKSFRLSSSCEKKSEIFKPVIVNERSSEKIGEENQPSSHADQSESGQIKKTSAKRSITVKKAIVDNSPEESKLRTRSRKKHVPVQLERKDLGENNVTGDSHVSALDSERSSNMDPYEERRPVSIKSVMIVDSVEKAEMVVEQLMSEYKNVVHACDTEVAGIDVKKESPVGHGQITCFSIYCGPGADFGYGKNRLWVDVLDGGDDVLRVFKRYFEDPSIQKVWHNYSFDKHILSRHGIHPQGFYADTMHLARLNDSARRGSKGGYALEVLSADRKVMDYCSKNFTEEDGSVFVGKKSMKELFGKAKLKKDGTPGKIKVVPPVDELQRDEELRDAWIHYSTLDAVCTWRLFVSLQHKLSNTPWSVAELRHKGSMYDFYEKYWRPFGEVLVQMEAYGMLVDYDHLATVEKLARAQQKISVSRFRKWAARYCPNAARMNVGSDAQIRQFLFGGTANRKDADQALPMERVFSTPNTDGFIEEGKKIAKKTKPMVITGLANHGIKIPVETYTSSGWPAVGGAAIRALAGKVSIDYSDIDDDAAEGVLEVDTEPEVSLTSAGVETDHEEDLSVYGKAYKAFLGGQEGKEACMALAALCEVASINTLLSNFIEPLQGNDIKSVSDGRVHCSLNINTETGRLSARRPSLQNQPALEKDRYKIRQAFVAAPGKALVVADYGQV
uniref:DNA-directed DNA polymerase family A palm domain-containing protein n=1 Tax=Physcomitrium patens TaxID=3218 RepID=A0A7I4CPA7_PHYPA